MATAALRGDARIRYTPSGGSETTHTLAEPIRDFTRRTGRRFWKAFTSDGRTPVTYSLTNGYDEIEGTIRFENQPNALRSLLEEGLYNDVTLHYSEDGGSTEYALKLVELPGSRGDQIELTLDRQRFSHGEWEVAVVLRRVDGGSLDALMPDAT